MGRALLLLVLLAACAPLPEGPGLPYPGGFVRGSVVEGRFQAILPGAPLLVDADAEALYAAYPYQLLEVRAGKVQSLPLPGVPRFLRARPRLAVGLEGGVLTPRGLLPYPAQDALETPEGLYWVDAEGLHLEGRLLLPGSFRQVVAWEGEVVALGTEAHFFPSGRRLALPAPALKAQAARCGVAFLAEGGLAHLLTPTGLTPLGPAEDLAAWEDSLYLSPGERTLRCGEVPWS